MERIIAHGNPYFGSKIEIQKNMLKSILQIILSFSVQKNAQKIPNIREMKAF